MSTADIVGTTILALMAGGIGWVAGAVYGYRKARKAYKDLGR